MTPQHVVDVARSELIAALAELNHKAEPDLAHVAHYINAALMWLRNA